MVGYSDLQRAGVRAVQDVESDGFVLVCRGVVGCAVGVFDGVDYGFVDGQDDIAAAIACRGLPPLWLTSDL